jgi:hypothetical protein
MRGTVNRIRVDMLGVGAAFRELRHACLFVTVIPSTDVTWWRRETRIGWPKRLFLRDGVNYAWFREWFA